MLCLVAAAAARGQEPENLSSEPLAEAFGSAPLVRGLRLSPDGSRISFVQMHPDHYPLVNVFDIRSGEVTTVLAGQPDGYDIGWCAWANEKRLLCSLRFIEELRGYTSPRTRLAAVNADGSEPSLLLNDDQTLSAIQYQDKIVDWLPDDPEHVLLGLRISRYITVGGVSFGNGSSVARLNIYNGDVRSVDGAEDDAIDWISDGYGTPRLRVAVSLTHRTWYVREQGYGAWSILHQVPLVDLDDAFSPVAFDRDANEVLFFDLHDGRRALYAMELDNDRARRLLYAHPRVDVRDVYRMGRHNRVVAAVAIEDRPVLHFVEPAIERVQQMLASEFPGMTINVIDEDWAERRYLVFVNSDRDPGTYYVFDTDGPELRRFARAFPALGERELAAMEPIGYSAADGTEIPAYLTLPPEGTSGAGVVLPRGGPSPDDYWHFNFLAQFLAAKGYAVLQANYRESAVYGRELAVDGNFQDWRQAVDDIADGARYLVEAGIAEPRRLCVMGWSYGGYLALMSAIEHERLYRCVVSIAGVTDPAMLASNARHFVGARGMQELIDSGQGVRRQGSPLKRADEIFLPTLLIHPRLDYNVPLEHSVQLRDAMRDERANVELIEYEHAEHSISPARYRIDMLARLGGFLDTHLGAYEPDFYSRAPVPADSVEIVDFGTDASRPNGICSDERFLGADGSILRDAAGRVRGTHDDATDCRRLYRRGEIVLNDSFAPDLTGGGAAENRATFFVDPVQQASVGIVSVDDESVGRRPSVSVVYARPGYRVIGVRATEPDYACTVSVADIEGAANGSESEYAMQPVGRGASFVRIPAYAGRLYRIRSSVVDGVLLVNVVDATENRVVVDQRELVASGCD